MVMSFASSYDGHESWMQVVQDLPFLAHPLVGLVVLASHRSATRADRDGAVELFASCPTAVRTRIRGGLEAAWAPTLALAAFFAAYVGVVDGFSTGVDGAFDEAAVPVLLAGLTLGAGGVALGQALGRWVRNPLAPVVAIVVIAFASLRLANGDPGEVTGLVLLSTLAGSADASPALTSAQSSANLAWLVAITVATGAVALAGGRRQGTVPAVAAPSVPDAIPVGATP